MDNLISGCFITYNEEKNIKSFIENVRDFLDEIIIVDGYSTDNTVRIAKELGAKVYQRKFDDYSSQRNFALEKAIYPWRFVLDLDERISDGFKKILPNLFKSKKSDCFKVKIFHYRTEDKKLMTVGWKRVLFRNYGIYWGELHERAISFKYERKIVNDDVYVTEYKSETERFQNLLRYKKMLTALYLKYRKNNQILLVNKLVEHLIPDHNQRILIEFTDKTKQEQAYIDLASLINSPLK
jgi:glycosyltransferase involved in cell wall biosynthesis